MFFFARTSPYTQKSFLNLVKPTGIRWYLPLSDQFGTKPNFVRIKINQKTVNTIWFRLIQQDSGMISLCVETRCGLFFFVAIFSFFFICYSYETKFYEGIIKYSNWIFRKNISSIKKCSLAEIFLKGMQKKMHMLFLEYMGFSF